MVQVLIVRKKLFKVVNIEGWSKLDLDKFQKAYSEEKGYEILDRRI